MKSSTVKVRAALAAVLTGAMTGLALGAAPPAAVGAAEVSMVPVGTVGQSGHAGLYGWGAATMCNGDVLIGDYWNMRVLRFAEDGTPKDAFVDNAGFGATQHQAPYGLAVDPGTCDVFMADTDRRQVDRYTEDGEYVRSYGQNGVVGETSTTFRYPSRVAVRDGMLFVADTWANRISVWRLDGTQELFRLQGNGGADGQFRQPRGMSFDSDGRLHVADQGNKRVQVFAVDVAAQRLDFLYKYGRAFVPGGAGDQVVRGDLRGLAIDEGAGFSYLVDGEGNRVHKFRIDGTGATYVSSFGQGVFTDGGREATVDQLGRVWVGNMPGFSAEVFSAGGDHLSSYPDPPQPPPPGGFNGPRGVAVDPTTKNLFVSDTYNFRIQKLAPSGEMLEQWGTRGRAPYEFNYTRLLAVDPRDGSVIVTDTDNHRIKKYDRNGTFEWEVGESGTGQRQFKNPHGIDIGPDGTIYVADTNNGRVQVLDPDGWFVRFVGTLGAGNGQFRRPRGVVADDATGQIYVADATRKNVQVFSPTGQYEGTFGAAGTMPVPMGGPFDIEVDDEFLYVADTPRNKIVVFDKATRQYVAEFGGAGTVSGKLNQPQGLDLVDGILYIAEQKNERISKWRVTRGTVVPDTTKPATTITGPTANQTFSDPPATIEGTATDDIGVQRVEVAIQDRTTKQWWNPAGNRWQATPKLWIRADVGSPDSASTTWSYSFADPVPGSGGYVVTRRAVDTSGNLEPVAPGSGVRFNVLHGDTDDTKPTSAVTAPTMNQRFTAPPVSIVGTATDDVGVGRVEVRIQHRTTKQWWNPDTGTWQGPAKWIRVTVDAAGQPSTTWRYSFDPGGAGPYVVTRRAVDTSGNAETVVSGSGVRFTLG
jgi:tripartite motif-containing protein 71